MITEVFDKVSLRVPRVREHVTADGSGIVGLSITFLRGVSAIEYAFLVAVVHGGKGRL